MATADIPIYFVASPNDSYYSARTLARHCASGNVTEVTEFLKSSKLKIREPLNVECGPYGWPCLLYACRYLNEEVIAYLLKIGANPNFCTACGLTPLMTVAIASSPQKQKQAVVCAKRLVGSGANVANSPLFNGGSTLLTMAAFKGSDDLVGYLIKAGANPNERDHNGETAFNVAVSGNRKLTVELLFQAGANPFIKNLHGERCIDLAAKNIRDGSEDLKLFVKSLLYQFYQTKYNGSQQLLDDALEHFNRECKPFNYSSDDTEQDKNCVPVF